MPHHGTFVDGDGLVWDGMGLMEGNVTKALQALGKGHVCY